MNDLYKMLFCGCSFIIGAVIAFTLAVFTGLLMDNAWLIFVGGFAGLAFAFMWVNRPSDP